MPIGDPVLAAMQAQYANQAAFHAGSQQHAVLDSSAVPPSRTGSSALAGVAGVAVAGVRGRPAGLLPAVGLMAQPSLPLPAKVGGHLAGSPTAVSEAMVVSAVGASAGGNVAPAASAALQLRWPGGVELNTAATPSRVQGEAAVGAASAAATAVRLQRLKEDKAREEANAQEEAERQRCHLHKRPKEGCKFCQRHREFVSKKEEDKAALRNKFISNVRRQGRHESRSDELGDMRRVVDLVNPKTFGFPPLLQSHIVESTHFKTLMELEQFEEITEELYTFADTVEPYLQNSNSVPSALFCCVYRLLTMGLDGQRLRLLIENEESSFIRCAGFLFIRFGLAPDQLWPWLGEYVLDDEVLRPTKDAERPTTIGEYVEGLLTQERYFSTVLPRLPMSTKRQLEVRLAQVPQFRKRTQANQRFLDIYRQQGVRIEACLDDGEWRAGEVVELVESASSRMKLRARLGEGGDEVTVHLGKVILVDSRFTAAAGFHSRSPLVDWAREKGKSDAELLEELRKREQDRAVCSSKSEYARRPVSFKVALPMEQGSASHRLIQDETAVSASKRIEHRERSRSPALQARSREHSAEYQARMRQLFEKYGMAKGVEVDALRSRSDIEGPDVMRLG